jgi:hypothetical protein
MRTGARTALLLALGCAPLGCSRGGDENLGMKGPARRAVDLTHLTRPAELVAAIGQPGRELDALIGPHRLEASSQLKIELPSGPAETLDEGYLLDTDGRGNLHLSHDNDRSGGMEAILAGGELYVRPRWGRFLRRRPEGDEIDALRRGVEGVAADYLALLEPWLQVRDSGRLQVGGRAALKLALSAIAEPTHVPEEPDPARAWRSTIKVRYIDGELLVDQASGALLQARLSAAYSFERSGEKGPLTATLTLRQSVSAAGTIAAPTDAVRATRRPRPMLDRDELLKGL